MHNPYKDFSKVNPQREDGRREIENSVFQALMHAGFSGAEYQVIFCVIDKTWGFNKKEDLIPLTQFIEATGLDKRNIAHYLDRLEKRHVLIIQRSGPGRGHGNTYMFNKHWDTWVLDNTRPTKGVPATPLEEKVSPAHQLNANGVAETPISGKVLPEHQLDTNGVRATPLGNGVRATPISAGKGVDSAGKGVAHVQGKGVPATPSKESIKKVSKETILSGEGLIKILPRLPGWFFDKEDKQWVAEFLEDFPDADLMALKACAEYHSSKPPVNKGVWKNRFRNWIKHEREWRKEKDSAEEKEKGVVHGSGKPGSGEGRGPDAYPPSTGRFPFRAISSGPSQPD